jgi:hypothetical protein
MPPMTQALSRANWIGLPSLTGLWLEALLRGIAMLWSNVAATFRMSPSRPARDLSIEARRAQMECHTMQTPQALPGETPDLIKEILAAANGQTTEALTTCASRRSEMCSGLTGGCRGGAPGFASGERPALVGVVSIVSNVGIPLPTRAPIAS